MHTSIYHVIKNPTFLRNPFNWGDFYVELRNGSSFVGFIIFSHKFHWFDQKKMTINIADIHYIKLWDLGAEWNNFLLYFSIEWNDFLFYFSWLKVDVGANLQIQWCQTGKFLVYCCIWKFSISGISWHLIPTKNGPKFQNILPCRILYVLALFFPYKIIFKSTMEC